jgi:hypothetical protein
MNRCRCSVYRRRRLRLDDCVKKQIGNTDPDCVTNRCTKGICDEERALCNDGSCSKCGVCRSFRLRLECVHQLPLRARLVLGPRDERRRDRRRLRRQLRRLRRRKEGIPLLGLHLARRPLRPSRVIRARGSTMFIGELRTASHSCAFPIGTPLALLGPKWGANGRYAKSLPQGIRTKGEWHASSPPG